MKTLRPPLSITVSASAFESQNEMKATLATNTKTKTGEPQKQGAVLPADARKLLNGVDDFEGFGVEGQFAEVALWERWTKKAKTPGVRAAVCYSQTHLCRLLSEFHVSMPVNVPTVPRTYHPAPQLENAVAPAHCIQRQLAQPRLPCLRGPSGKTLRYVAAPFAGLLPNTARDIPHTPTAPARSKPFNLPTAGHSQAPAPVRAQRARRHGFARQPGARPCPISANKPPAVRSSHPCNSPHRQCQLLEGSRVVGPSNNSPSVRMRNVRAMFGPLRLSRAKYEYTFRTA